MMAGWFSRVHILPFFTSKAHQKRWRLSLIKDDGWKRHPGKPEYAAQEEAQKIGVIHQSKGEGGGRDSFKPALLLLIHLLHF